jgi:hypothetical protein
MHPRRWQERQRQAAEAERRTALASVFLGQRNAVSGTEIPAGHPSRTALLAAGYACTEDLPDPAYDGPDDTRDELMRADIGGDDADTLLEHLGYDLSE